jgi:predicted nucleic acid-binding protein
MKVKSKSGFRSNDLSSGHQHPHFAASSETAASHCRWQSTKVTDMVLCSVVVYDLRHGAESSSDPAREHVKLDVFLAPFSSLPSDASRRFAWKIGSDDR